MSKSTADTAVAQWCDRVVRGESVAKEWTTDLSSDNF